MHLFSTVYRTYGNLVSAAATIAGIAIFALMWINDANVVMRYFLNAPVMGAVEISQALLVLGIMLGMAFTQASGGHVRVTLLTRLLPPRGGEIAYALAALIGFFVFCAVTYSTFGYALRSYQVNEYAWGATLRFPLYPVKAAACLGALLLAIQFLLDAIRVGVFGLTEKRDDLAGRAREEILPDA